MACYQARHARKPLANNYVAILLTPFPLSKKATMTITEWNLSERSAEPKECDFRRSAQDVPGTPVGWSVCKRTLHGGASEGVELVEIDNGRLTLKVVASRGLGIWHAEMDGERLGWNSPVRGPIHPVFVPLMDPAGTGWLEGFDELMVRCGLESNGSAVFSPEGRLVYPLHGKIANRPAHSLRITVDDVAGTIALHGVVDEIRFHFQKLQLVSTLTTSFHGTTFEWHDQVINLGGGPAQMQMLYHINIGRPLLTPGARLIAPVRTVSPHDCYLDPGGTSSYRTYPEIEGLPMQQSYFCDLLAGPDAMTCVLLQNAVQERGLAIQFNVRDLPCFSLWRNNVPDQDGYVTALEPGTNFPNPRPFEEQHGRIISLAAGEKWQATVKLDWLTDRHKLSESQRKIEQLQGDTLPEIHELPLPDWSAKAL